MSLRAGDTIAGEFVAVRLIGRGGMGEVWAVDQVSVGRRRALKLMRGELLHDVRLRERFTLEARIGGQIDSDHIVEVIAAGIDPQRGPWIAMELLEGWDLAGRVDAHGALARAEARELFDQLGHAVGAAHRAGIVHRDLKPENVFIARPRRSNAPFTVKVLDFGIAKLVAEALRTKSTAAIGSPLWMAPEQMEVGDAITPAADVWALGLIAFYGLVGAPFWRNAIGETNVHAIVREIILDPMVAASHRAGELGGAERLPFGFDPWFARCLARDPRERLPNAGVAMDELNRLLSPTERSITTGTQIVGGPAVQPALPEPAPSRSRGPSPAALWIAVFAVALGTIVALWIVAPKAPPTVAETPTSVVTVSSATSSKAPQPCTDAASCLAACEHDVAASCFALSSMYRNGVDVEASAEKELAFLKRACELNHPKACALASQRAAAPSVAPIPSAAPSAAPKPSPVKVKCLDVCHHEYHECKEKLGPEPIGAPLGDQEAKASYKKELAHCSGDYAACRAKC